MRSKWQRCFKELGIDADMDMLKNEAYKHGKVYPPEENIYRAFDFFDPEETKVVLIGQDPYHGKGQANGLSFSVNGGEKIPPSLRNIYKELQTDLGCDIPDSGNLESWAQQGVLLLNAVLTVEESKAGSHQQLGWQTITKSILQHLAGYENLVFILLGAWAQKFAEDINLSQHKVIAAHHPSPLSAHRGFFGSKIFSETNRYLIENQKTPIQWAIHQNKQYEFNF